MNTGSSKNKKIVIDGRQLTRRYGGVQRYLREVLLELDKVADANTYEIIVPQKAKVDFELNNIPIVYWGKMDGLLWEQLELPRYLSKTKAVGVFFCTIYPFFYKGGVVVLHDIMARRSKIIRKSMNPFLYRIFSWNNKVAVRKAGAVITDTHYVKHELIREFGVNPSKIHSCGCGWQHMERIEEDDGWMNRYPQIEKGNYFFSLSANRIQKNFNWISQVAKTHPQELFLIAGTSDEWQNNNQVNASNLIWMGELSDGEIKSLMKNSKAFLFPSTDEGFGIPPLEALGSGATVISAYASCMPEIFGNTVHYIDPYDFDVNIIDLLKGELAPADSVLEKYSWSKTAKRVHEICKNISNSNNRGC